MIIQPAHNAAGSFQPAARPGGYEGSQEGNAVKTYLLYLPAILCFVLPVLNIIYQDTKARRATRVKEEQRRRAAEIKQIEQAAKQAARERAAEIKRAERQKAAAGSETRRKPGRPRKSSATIPAKNTTAGNTCQPAPLPTSCTPEQFAAWIN